jgi:tRNA(fMet)-specific endonuclease VapC
MAYLLDTVVLSQYLRGRAGAMTIVQPLLPQSVTSILVYAEIVEYIRGLQNSTQWAIQLQRLMRTVRPLRLTYAIGNQYADLRRVLRPQGQLIGDVDLFIAATTLVHGLTLVTADSDFLRIPNLLLQLVPRDALR